MYIKPSPNELTQHTRKIEEWTVRHFESVRSRISSYFWAPRNPLPLNPRKRTKALLVALRSLGADRPAGLKVADLYRKVQVSDNSIKWIELEG